MLQLMVPSAGASNILLPPLHLTHQSVNPLPNLSPDPSVSCFANWSSLPLTSMEGVSAKRQNSGYQVIHPVDDAQLPDTPPNFLNLFCWFALYGICLYTYFVGIRAPISDFTRFPGTPLSWTDVRSTWHFLED